MRKAETREDAGPGNNGHLSPGFAMPQPGSSHGRSTSATPSMRSNYSGITTVGESGDSSENSFEVRRQRTFRAEIKLTWWDCFRGLILGPRKVAQEAITTLRTQADGLDENMYDDEDCPFLVTVTVWPRENPTPDRFESARCIFDTGCLQGNIISDTLAYRLGFVNFEIPSSRERKGGMSASGHTLTVKGAIYLTWHHSTSSKIFKDMRFLVSSNVACDMLIGARSIQKHNLMSPPSFMVGEGAPAHEGTNVISFKASIDNERDKLAGNEAQARVRYQNAQAAYRNNPTDKHLTEQRDSMKQEYEDAKKKKKDFEAVSEEPNSQHREGSQDVERKQNPNDRLRQNTSIQSTGKASGSTQNSQSASDGVRKRS